MADRDQSYDEIVRAFRWRIPDVYNIAVDVCDRHAARDATALIIEDADGQVDRVGFGALARQSNRLANALAARGVGVGDRVAVLLGQRLETALVHLAVWKLGAISVPLFTLFGEDALAYRLADAGVGVLVTDAANLAKIDAIRDRLPALSWVLSVDGAGSGCDDLWDAVDRAADRFTAHPTRADDPAVIIYTSGTTGPPKGALHAHRTLLGHLPGVCLPHDRFPQPGDLFWTPADWAWIGGLFDVLMPAWHFGVPVLAHRARKFDPDQALALMARHGVRNVFMPPTALKLLRQAARAPGEIAGAHPRLRSLASGGETLGAELLDWGRRVFDLTINEFYGQTECNLIVGNSATIFPVRPGAMGRPIPGHQVAVIGPDGVPVAPGTPGTIAVRRGDPIMFLSYWNKPEATAAKFVGDWMVTGDVGRADDDGYLWFIGRDDDIITSAGYRIGPSEIEDCLIRHPAVALAAAVGVPDPVRTEIVKAFVVVADGVTPSDALAAEIQSFVKTRLAAHAYPRAVAFVDALPMTATGKIRRRDLRAAHTPTAESGGPAG